MNEAQIQQYLSVATAEDKQAMLGLLEELEDARHREECQRSFLSFVKAVWPDFIESAHHRVIARALEDVERGENKRLIINMAPRHTKSEFASYLFPAWVLGKQASRKIIQSSNTSELATRFGRKVRDLVDSAEYQRIFPGVGLKADSKAAGRWQTDDDGEYFAIGVKGRVTGRGADILIVDDPHDEQEAALEDASVYDKTYEYYTSGPRQRLQPGGAIVIVMTRWHKKDLTGQVLHNSARDDEADSWKVIQLPAILDENTENERPIWPSFWSIEELRAVRATISVTKWKAQYQQEPTSEEGAIIKRSYWRLWPTDRPPKVTFIIQTWDTAYSSKESADYSASTTWGIWNNDDDIANIILLDALRGRWDFPELKEKARDNYRRWKPDAFIVEGKSAGLPLASELRKSGIVVSVYVPVRGADKVTRTNAISDVFSSGLVWYPNRRWAEDVVSESSEFPFGDHDDYHDTVLMAIARYREGGFVVLPSDEIHERTARKRSAAYY